MKSRLSSSFILLLLCGVLGAVYWFGFKDKTPAPTTEPAPTREQIEITNFDTSQVQEVSWEAGSTKGTVQRVSDSEWKLINPPIAVDQEKAQSLATTASKISGENKYSFGELSKKDAGFDFPTSVVTIKTKDGKSERIIVGKKTIDESYYYVTKDGLDYSTLVYTYLIDDLSQDPYSLGPSPSTSPVGSPTTQ